MTGDATCKEVWHWVELGPDGPTKASLEVAGKAREIAGAIEGKPAAVVVWPDEEPHPSPAGPNHEFARLLRELSSFGIPKVYALLFQGRPSPSTEVASPDGSGYSRVRPWEYRPLTYTRALCSAVACRLPDILLLPASANGMDLAPRVAARLGTGLTAHCIDLQVREVGGVPLLVQVVPGFGESVTVHIACPEKRPQMATVRPGVFPLPEKADSSDGISDEEQELEVVRITVAWDKEDDLLETLGYVSGEDAGADMERAEVVVAGGWGMAVLGGFEPLFDIARILGAAVGGTRPAVDRGWIGPERMIGQSGRTVRPKLFMSFGASGAMHFATGFLNSQTIFAVTNDPEAPILKMCDVGIIGDLREVLPVLAEKLLEARKTSA